jgi:hypothetical protein
MFRVKADELSIEEILRGRVPCGTDSRKFELLGGDKKNAAAIKKRSRSQKYFRTRCF